MKDLLKRIGTAVTSHFLAFVAKQFSGWWVIGALVAGVVIGHVL